MNWLLEKLGHKTVSIVRRVEPSFLTEETSLAWQAKDARAAAALQKTGEVITTIATGKLRKLDAEIRAEVPKRQLRKSLQKYNTIAC